jgi:hypothetical protein
MSLSVAHVDIPKKTLGFVSDEKEVDKQLVDLRGGDHNDLFTQAAKEHFHLSSPGIVDQSTRYLDRKSNALVMTQPANGQPDDLIHEGEIRYKPVLLLRFDSIYD